MGKQVLLVDPEVLEELIIEFPDSFTGILDLKNTVFDMDRIVPVYNLNQAIVLEYDLIEYGTLSNGVRLEFDSGYGFLGTYGTAGHTGLDYEMTVPAGYADIEFNGAVAVQPSDGYWNMMPYPVISCDAYKVSLLASGVDCTVLKYIQVRVKIAS